MRDGILKPGWKVWRFDQMAINVNDRIDNPSEADVEHYVGLEHLDPDSLKIRRWGVPSDVEATKLCFRKGDIIFGRRRVYQRKLAVAEFDGICSAHAMVLRPQKDVVLPEFLPFFMQSDLFMTRALEISVGSLSPTINWKTLAVQEFALPPLEEQRRIAALLESSQRLVETNRFLAEKLGSLVASYAKQHLATHLDTFPTSTIPDLTDRLTVGIVVRPADWYVPVNSGIPALRSLNVFPGRLEMADLARISDEGHSYHKKSQLHAGDVVIVRTGRPGDAAVIPHDIGPLNCIDLIVVTPNSRILPEYLAHYLNSPVGRQQFAAGSAGTAQQHFNVKEFRNLEIPCPPIDIQSSFVSDLLAIESGYANAKNRFEWCSKNHHLLVTRSVGDWCE